MQRIQLLAAFLALFTFASAWPWPPSLPGVGEYGQIEDIILRRQVDGGDRNNDNASSDSPGNSASTTADEGPPKETGDSSSGDAKAAPKTTSKPTQTAKDSDKDNDRKGKPTTRSVAQNAQAGAINMITPAATGASSAYYSVGSTVTWAWNYTNLVNPPQAINILATVSPAPGQGAPSPFTIDTNVTWNKIQNYTWDTGAFADKTALPNNIYTLIVYDADVEGGVTAIPNPGSLGVNKQFHFGMYNGAKYTALTNPYICATCNSAMGQTERLTIWGILAMAGVTVVSFSWFAVGWGTL